VKISKKTLLLDDASLNLNHNLAPAPPPSSPKNISPDFISFPFNISSLTKPPTPNPRAIIELGSTRPSPPFNFMTHRKKHPLPCVHKTLAYIRIHHYPNHLQDPRETAHHVRHNARPNRNQPPLPHPRIF